MNVCAKIRIISESSKLFAFYLELYKIIRIFANGNYMLNSQN